MGNCQNLATKAELQELETKLLQALNGKLDQSEKDGIVRAGAVAGLGLAVAKYDPIVGGLNGLVNGLKSSVSKNAGKIAKNVGGIAKNAAGLAGFAGQIAIVLLQLTAIAALEVQILRLKNQVNAVKAQALENEIQISKNNAAIAVNTAKVNANNVAISQNNVRISSNARDIALNQADIAASNSLARTAINRADNANKSVKQVKAEVKQVKAQVARDIAKTEVKLESQIAEVEKGIDIQMQRVNIETAIVKQQINASNQLVKSLKSLISGMRLDISSAFSQLQTKADEPEVRRIKKRVVTNSSGITDLNGQTIGLPALKSQVSSNTTKITKVYETQQQQSKVVVVGGSGITSQKATEIATEIATEQGELWYKRVGENFVTGTKFGTVSQEIRDKLTTSINGFPSMKEIAVEIDARITGKTKNLTTEAQVTGLINTGVKSLEKVNKEQYTDIKTRISNLADAIPQTLGKDLSTVKTNTAGLAPGIASLQLATAPAALAAAAATGVCQTTAPGGCMNNNILQPMNDTIRDTANAAGASAAIANNVILNQMQPVLNTVKKTTDFIKGTTSATYDIVSHAKHGLQASYNFAQKAWGTLPIDKAMQGITLVASVHNAAMLSQNAAQSLGDAASQALQLFNIKNPVTGEAIDVNQVLGRTVKNTIERLLGAEAFAAATETWLKVNRIHQAAGATCCAIVGTRNALLEADEITGGNVAKLANSLQSQGVLEDDSFSYMDETPDYKTPFGGILGFIDKVDDFGNRVSSIVNSGLEIQQSSAEFVENSNQLKQAIDDFDIAKKEEENAKDLESVSPDIDRLDLIKEEIPE